MKASPISQSAVTVLTLFVIVLTAVVIANAPRNPDAVLAGRSLANLDDPVPQNSPAPSSNIDPNGIMRNQRGPDERPSMDRPVGINTDRKTVGFDPLADTDQDAIRSLFADTRLVDLQVGIKQTGPRTASVTASFWINNTYLKVRHVVEKHDTEWVKTSSHLISEIRF